MTGLKPLARASMLLSMWCGFGCGNDGAFDETPPDAIAGKVFYVSTASGANDESDGSAREYDRDSGHGPWKTLGKAAKVAQPGDVIRVLAGTYSEPGIEFRRSGSVARPITIVGAGVDRVRIDGTSRKGTGILLAANHIKLSGLTIRSWEGPGLKVKSNDKPLRGIHVEDVLLEKNGFGAEVTSVEGITLIRVTANENRFSGITVTDCAPGKISSCVASSNGREGIRFTRCGNLQIRENRLTSNGKQFSPEDEKFRWGGVGLILEDCKGNEIRANISQGHRISGITLSGCVDNKLVANESFKNSMRGVTVTGGSRSNRLETNKAHHNGILGIAFYAGKENVCRGNLAYNNAVMGFVTLHGGNANRYEKNEAYGNGRGGFYCEGSSDNVYEGNYAHDNVDGFLFHNALDGEPDPSLRTRLTGNRAVRNSGYGYVGEDGSVGENWVTQVLKENKATNNGKGSAVRVTGNPSLRE